MDPINIKDFVGLGGIPIVQALVALFKTTFPSFPARYYPSVSIVVGVILNEGLGYLLGTDPSTSAVVGLIIGLIASGLFQYGKSREAV